MTLKAQIEADVDAVFLQTDDHAETCTYFPNGGNSRSIVAVVDEDSTDTDEGMDMWRVERLQVFVSRDADDGISDPQLGDGIRREDDTDDKVYSYAGIRSEADQFAWTLDFTRKVPLERGGHRMQR